MALTGFNSDIIGTIRPQGNGWDVGAYEYNGNIGTIYSDHALSTGNYSFHIIITGTGVRFFCAGVSDIGCPSISIYDVSGRLITQLPLYINDDMYTVLWNEKDVYGNKCASGWYVARLNNSERGVKQSFILLP